MGTVIELTAAPSTGTVLRRATLGMLSRRSGTSLPDTTLVLRDVAVDRDRLHAYERVCGFRLTDQLPATYPHIMAFPLAMTLMSTDGFPFPVVGVVHVANRIEQLRAIGADERLEFAVRAADLREHERGRQFDVLVTASVGDEVVWRGVSTYLRKERSAGERAPRESTEPPAPTAIWRVGREVGPRYAAVSGDRNPIHTSRLGARAFGFPRPIAHGMWSKARCLAALEGRLPDAYKVDVKFKLPIPLPTTVTFASAPTDNGWSLALNNAKSANPHLTGAVTPRRS
jgi:acyl dehydratase